MTQYLRPKILGTVPSSQKNTDLNYEFLIKGDQYLNPETCKPYDSREKLSRDTVDYYDNNVIDEYLELLKEAIKDAR